ncbi:hypothetical protein AGRA3207_002451 [Actinomadura graeca]|uniref:Uncharacterized protein n=1 Tax=Actinomadura graeca TaxID=2750812 RepID=A0ABX8R5U9_9ACTN|nr:hypothetical protein AGRA3207_002451 [Actinomadura graeca]
MLESPALETGFLEEAGPDREGRKGAGGEVALWVLGAATARPASQVLITLIKEWSTRERHRRVEISYGDDQVTLTGRPDDAQERLVREFLDRIDRRNRTE